MKGILGRKVGMTQIFADNGNFIPVSVIEAGPMFVTQIKTVETDGYNAIQVGFEPKKESRTIKPERGHFAKSGVDAKRVVREFRLDSVEGYELGQEIDCSIFEAGTLIDVAGTSKGKGTQGPIRRWNQSRGPETHGSKYHRGGGSIGAASYPARVIKGMKMAGRMGNERVTVQNLELVRVDAERNLLLVKGAIPGPKGGLVVVQEAVKASK
ncbi:MULTISPECIES: 50S ribosomal protein L3 [unclassified Fusibacter]|uniref:50S ribosomal protein L3 n=1 Tax=unclassified Fusibacter TaxID=2624464 RepID=UPI0010134AE3|nr:MULTISPECIES: 50S ribosomal protein L3 [unclassified Fusibacter]MCK8061512.1 50S ribosomal protein L3 [Fusibacter sp. A2]NPE23760.1 50S ribosomal protein L3 [Fusibacter sp. A1]RXV58787.1 50S ribosomal protein L3 [Fusibacter sp. A1]